MGQTGRCGHRPLRGYEDRAQGLVRFLNFAKKHAAPPFWGGAVWRFGRLFHFGGQTAHELFIDPGKIGNAFKAP